MLCIVSSHLLFYHYGFKKMNYSVVLRNIYWGVIKNSFLKWLWNPLFHLCSWSTPASLPVPPAKLGSIGVMRNKWMGKLQGCIYIYISTKNEKLKLSNKCKVLVNIGWRNFVGYWGRDSSISREVGLRYLN